MRILCSILFPVISAVTLCIIPVSCAREYDINTVDKTVSVGGQYFTLPLGFVGPVSPDSLLRFDRLTNLIYDENGDISLYYQCGADAEFLLEDLVSVLKPKRKSHVFKDISFVVPYGGSASGPIRKSVILNMPFTDTVSYSCLEEAGVKRLDSLVYSDCFIEISGSISAGTVAYFPSGVTVSVEMELPERHRYSGKMISGTTFSAAAAIRRDGSFSFGKASLLAYECQSAGHGYEYTDTFILKSVTLDFPDSATYKMLEGKTARMQISLSTSDDMIPQKMYGIFDRDLGHKKLNFYSPAFEPVLKNARFAFFRPYILLDVESNFTADVSLYMSITSFSDGKAVIMESDTLELESSEHPARKRETLFYMGDDVPAGDGVRYEYFPVSSLLAHCFDSLSLDLVPVISSGRERSENQVIWLKDRLRLGYDISLHAPLCFSDSLYVSFRDTIPVLSKTLMNIFESNDVVLVADSKMTFPLDVEVYFRMLDTEGKYMGVSSSRTIIKGTVEKGMPRDSTYLCELKSFDDARALGGIEVVYTFMAGSDPSLILNRYDSLSLTLKVSVPGGVTYDLDKL